MTHDDTFPEQVSHVRVSYRDHTVMKYRVLQSQWRFFLQNSSWDLVAPAHGILWPLLITLPEIIMVAWMAPPVCRGWHGHPTGHCPLPCLFQGVYKEPGGSRSTVCTGCTGNGGPMNFRSQAAREIGPNGPLRQCWPWPWEQSWAN